MWQSTPVRVHGTVGQDARDGGTLLRPLGDGDEMRIVVALGGNALLARGEKPDAELQLEHVETAARALAPIAAEHEVVLCHGNGPQVGLLALESAADRSLSEPYPLDVLGAQTQGMLGYWLAQSLRNAGVTRPVVSVVTQIRVDGADPAFGRPSKFIGATYDRAAAERMAARHGWTVAPDGARWRRVVPSPQPLSMVEQPSVDLLLRAGTLVVCGGGGGAPVVTDAQGRLRGIEAVVDKDATAAMLAESVAADHLLVLTDVAAVMRDFGTPHAAPVRRIEVDELAAMTFPAGSMGPKIDACRRFVAATGRSAAIGSLREAAAVLAGTAGTTIAPATSADPATVSRSGKVAT
ncbi:MAG: carbamate kinase [Mycobacterium sp.]|jgi:carbamate kinase|nr:carbamate kinase [Mycobacterium sp.]